MRTYFQKQIVFTFATFFSVNKANTTYYQLFNSRTSIINSKLTQHTTAADTGQPGQTICFLAYVVRFKRNPSSQPNNESFNINLIITTVTAVLTVFYANYNAFFVLNIFLYFTLYFLTIYIPYLLTIIFHVSVRYPVWVTVSFGT